MNTKILSLLRCMGIMIFFIQVTASQAQEDYQKQMDAILEIPANKIPSGTGMYVVKVTANNIERTFKIIKK